MLFHGVSLMATKYLFLSTIHKGYDPEVLELLANFRKHYELMPIHLGKICTDEELKMLTNRQMKIKTFDKQKEEISKVTNMAPRDAELAVVEAFEYLCSLGSTNIADVCWEEMVPEHVEHISTYDKRLLTAYLGGMIRQILLTTEVSRLYDAQQTRVDILRGYMPELQFLINDASILPGTEGLDDALWNEMNLGAHLKASATMANGDKVTGNPITSRVLSYYRLRGHSWILPHGIPAAEAIPDEGLNQAKNYFTTGSLRFDRHASKASDYYKAKNIAGALMVVVDNGQFFTKQIFIDEIDGELAILDDGLVFFKDKIIEAGRDNTAIHVTDVHLPYQNAGVMGAIKYLAEALRPIYFYDGGDTSNIDSFNPHGGQAWGELENKRFATDLGALRGYTKFIDDLKVFKYKTIIDSNHMDWVDRFLEKVPALKGFIDWDTLGKKYFKGWKIMHRSHAQDSIVRFMDIVLRHGDQENLYQAFLLFVKYIGGHFHRRMGLGRVAKTGPGCNLNAKYLKGSQTAWQNEITTLTGYKGVASFSIKTVLHKENTSRLLFRNEIVEFPHVQLEIIKD